MSPDIKRFGRVERVGCRLRARGGNRQALHQIIGIVGVAKLRERRPPALGGVIQFLQQLIPCRPEIAQCGGRPASANLPP